MEPDHLFSCKDDAQWAALAAPIRSTTANAEGVQSKLDFWKKCISSHCQHSKSSIFTCDELKKAFSRDGRTPQCIPTVIDDMASSKEVFRMNDFLEMKGLAKVAWSTWILQLSQTPMDWAWKKVKSWVLPAPTNNLEYIHKKTLEDKAEEILRHASDLQGNVIQLGDLLAKCKWPSNQLRDAMLAVHWLVCQNQAAIHHFDLDSPFTSLVKIAPNVGVKASMTEKDITKYRLLKAIEQAEARIAEYDTKISLAREEAKDQLRKNCKSLAMCQLKKKKRFESFITNQANTVMNLHGLLETLNQNEVNQEVLETLKTANVVIKTMHKESLLNEDSVLEVMDDVRDTMETQADIDSALSQSIFKEENGELEKELKSLIDEQTAEDNVCKFIDNLKIPDVPEAPLVLERNEPEANVA